MIAHRHLAAAHGHLDLAAGRGPLGRVVEQVGDRALDRGRGAADERLLEVGRERDVRPVPPRAADGVGGDEVEPDVLRLLGMLLRPRELDQLGDQRRHLAELLDHVAEQALPFRGRERALSGEDFDVRPQAGQRRAQLMRGVGDELPLGAARLLQSAEHGVEARGETAELVLAARLDPLREITGLGHVLGRLGQAAHRSESCLRDGEAEP